MIIVILKKKIVKRSCENLRHALHPQNILYSSQLLSPNRKAILMAPRFRGTIAEIEPPAQMKPNSRNMKFYS